MLVELDSLLIPSLVVSKCAAEVIAYVKAEKKMHVVMPTHVVCR